MADVLANYRNASDIPERTLTWYLYGSGMESFGKNGKPEQMPLPEFGPDELLVRVDAVGICFSDIKVINQGDKHPRLVGRNLKENPVTLGHEPSITVVGVGENLKDRFKVGERFIVQADVFHQGKSMAFGYVLAGAQSQYQVITRELLEGDEGCYLLPVAESTGYAEAALTEAGACVLASYRITRRPSIKQGGRMWIIGTAGDDCDYSLDLNADPKLVAATDLNWPMMDQLRFWSEAGRFELRETQPFDSLDVETFRAEFGDFEDIILLGASAEILEQAAQFLGKFGILNICASQQDEMVARIDVGKVHYQNHSYVGTTSRHISEAYHPVRMPSELRVGGTAWFIGAGGPMGQMHVQRAVGMENGPSKVLASDIDDRRLQSLREHFGKTAEAHGIELKTVNPAKMSAEEFDSLLKDFTGGRGFDDVVVLAPVPALIGQAVPYMADQGLMNIFAGVAIGTVAEIDMTGVYTKQIRFVGSSGSRLSDMRDTLDAVETGKLSTNMLVAAIGGIDASWDGMLAVKDGRFPGKIIIYPQIRGLELTAVGDLKERLPNVYAKMTDGMYWNNAAEEELLRTMLKG